MIEGVYKSVLELPIVQQQLIIYLVHDCMHFQRQ